MEQWTYAAGLILGSLLILTVVILAFKNSKVGMGEAFLVAMGSFLVGLTLWAKFNIEFGPGGLKAQFEQMQHQVNTLTETNLDLNKQVETMAIAADTERRQFAALTEVLQERNVVSPQSLEMIRGEVMSVPVVDRDRLRINREILERPPG